MFTNRHVLTVVASLVLMLGQGGLVHAAAPTVFSRPSEGFKVTFEPLCRYQFREVVKGQTRYGAMGAQGMCLVTFVDLPAADPAIKAPKLYLDQLVPFVAQKSHWTIVSQQNGMLDSVPVKKVVFSVPTGSKSGQANHMRMDYLLRGKRQYQIAYFLKEGLPASTLKSPAVQKYFDSFHWFKPE